jgi:FkbM family methyltransferase
MSDSPFVTIQLRRRTLVTALVVAGAVIAGASWGIDRSRRTVVAPPAARAPNPVQSAYEIDAFRVKYGPNHNTEREEEWLIRDHFHDRRGGVFIDVGANHYRATSKTYYLESQLGWSGIAIEPQREFGAEYAKYRPRTKFLPFFVSDVSNETARLYVLRHMTPVASADREFVKKFGTPDEVREVPTITLTDLLDAEGITRIDFLSMDIELHEPRALAGFDIGRFKPALVCVEALLPVRQAILDYFARNDYVLVGKYVWVDLENLYFAPLSSPKAESSATTVSKPH